MKHKLAAGTVVTLLLAGILITSFTVGPFKGILTPLVPGNESMRFSSNVTEPVFQKGMSYVSWPPNFDSADSDASLRLLNLTNTEWVAICVFWYQDSISSTRIYPSSNSPSNSSVIHAINVAHGLGMKVMLKPMVDPLDGNWRGQIPPSSAWFQSYASFINFWANFSQEYGVDMLCVGCEFTSNDVDTANWESIVAGVRARYSGPITYAANWSGLNGSMGYQSIHWWSFLDYVGIDAYFPLTNKPNPTVEELKNAWSQWVNSMEAWQATVNKPVVFTEIGYRSGDGANEAPWDYSASMPVDLQEQVDCYNAAFQTFWNRSWFYGFYWWNWETNPNAGGENDDGFTPQNKPVQSLITSRYTGTGHVPLHDIAVTHVASSKTIVGQNYSLNISVTAANPGDYPEAFNVTVYTNATIIGLENITLLAGNLMSVAFAWNTAGFAYGNYTLSGYAWPFPSETDTADNNCTGGWVIVSLVGDLTGPNGWPDGRVDMKDIGAVSRLFGVNYPSPRYNPNCDLNDDGKTDMKDIGIVARQFGKTTS